MLRVGSMRLDWLLIAILLLAFLIRLGVILAFPSIHHPDENFQLFEQGHRWFFGTGLVPWEFQLGTRSPVLPFLLGLTFKIVEPIVGGPEGYILVTRLLLAATSIAAVAAVYLMAKRTSVTHGILAGLVTAVWFELVYFAGRPLSEAVSATVLLIALSLASVSQQDFKHTRVISVGFCLALCMLLRVHFVLGLLLVAGWVGRLNVKRWWWMALGSLPPLIIFALADTMAWGDFSFLRRDDTPQPI